MKTKLGSELSPSVQRQILAAFVHRYTGEHKPGWARELLADGSEYSVQFANDADWLANTKFYVTKYDKLDGRYQSCLSYPTWPKGKINGHENCLH